MVFNGLAHQAFTLQGLGSNPSGGTMEVLSNLAAHLAVNQTPNSTVGSNPIASTAPGARA